MIIAQALGYTTEEKKVEISPEEINKYDTLAFIIETWKIGLAIYIVQRR